MQCRENFRLLEQGDKYCVDLWNKFKDLSMIDFEKIYKLLDIKFDSYKGEASYAKNMDEIINKLEKNGKLIEFRRCRNKNSLYSSKSKWIINICYT